MTQKAPTELERAGDFSQSINGVAGGAIIDPLTGQPFSGNVIPTTRFDPVAASLLSYIPLPNGNPDAAGNNYFVSPNSREDLYDSNLLKIDQNFAGNQRLSGPTPTTGVMRSGPKTAARSLPHPAATITAGMIKRLRP